MNFSKITAFVNVCLIVVSFCFCPLPAEAEVYKFNHLSEGETKPTILMVCDSKVFEGAQHNGIEVTPKKNLRHVGGRLALALDHELKPVVFRHNSQFDFWELYEAIEFAGNVGGVIIYKRTHSGNFNTETWAFHLKEKIAQFSGIYVTSATPLVTIYSAQCIDADQ